MIPKEIEKEIQRRIDAAEEEHGVKVLYAVESGSRAWGLLRQIVTTMFALFMRILKIGI